MVSKAKLDLPEPDKPVTTTSLLRGSVTSIFLRLCSRAPRTTIWSINRVIIEEKWYLFQQTGYNQPMNPKDWFYRHWKRTPSQVRKPFIFLLGFTIVGTGIVFLPLPGPGWLIIFFGFAILASEFRAAEQIRGGLVHALKLIITR